MSTLNLGSKESLRLAIRNRGMELAAKLTDEQIFMSPEFKDYVTKLADFILRNRKLYDLKLMWDTGKDAKIAYTDGKTITLNAGNRIALSPRSLERRFKCNLGIVFHETAHKLFMDFKIHNAALKRIEEGKFYGVFDTQGGAELEKHYDEMCSYLAKGYGSAFASIFANIANIINDGHDERTMKDTFPGYIADCITTAGEVQMELSPPLSEFIPKVDGAYNVFSRLFLEYAKFGTYKLGDPDKEVDDYMSRMSLEFEPIIDAALLTDDYAARWNYLNLLVLRLWPCLRKMFQDADGQGQSASDSASGGAGNDTGDPSGGGQQTGSNDKNGAGSSQQPTDGQQSAGGQSDSGNQNGDPQSSGGQPTNGQSSGADQLKNVLDNAAQSVSSAMGANPAPANCKGEAISRASITTGKIQPGNGNDVNKLTASIVQAQAEAEVQKELDKASMELIQGIDMTSTHKGIPLIVKRHMEPNETAYKQISAELAPYVRALTADMLALLRELNEESTEHHKRMGPIIEANEAYRPDRAFFAKKKLPADLPNMSLCILLDRSGSMNGSKLDMSIKALILLEQFASAIGIPLMIAAHDTVGKSVQLNIYTDFLSVMEQRDRYSLAGITASGSNRDGMAVRICADLLSKRQEDVRLMVVLSDGLPNHTKYSGDSACADISKAAREYRRKGLLIYGAAIDKDKEKIQQIYGNNFLSIEDLKAMPKTLVRLIRQQIV